LCATGSDRIFRHDLSRISGTRFDASELSDGTLRYLALAGALMAYRLPSFIALNEPETSLHQDLLDPLARLIVQASERTQLWLVTHSEALAGQVATARRHQAANGCEARRRNVARRTQAGWRVRRRRRLVPRNRGQRNQVATIS